jgi:hypothetical protein
MQLLMRQSHKETCFVFAVCELFINSSLGIFQDNIVQQRVCQAR